MAATWTYDSGAATVNAVINDAVPGDKYELWCSDTNSTPTTATASSTSLSITVTGIGGDAAGYGFGAYLYHGTSSVVDVSSPCVYDNVFSEGTSSAGAGISASWSYDGATGFSVSFNAVGGITYNLAAHVTTGTISSVNGGPYTDGSTQTLSLTSAAPTAGRSFWADVTNTSTSEDYTNRIFVQGIAGSGSSGNPGGSVPIATGRVLIAFTDSPLEPAPAWTVIDQGGSFPASFVAGYDITTGRQTLLAQTDTGTATVYINDHDLALFDPRNSASPYHGMLDGKQILLQLFNPVLSSWENQFRGWIDNITWDVDGSAVNAAGQPINESLQIECVDMFDVLAGHGLTPGLDGVTPPTGSEDSVYYAATAGSVDDRIIEILTDVGIDSTRYLVASGNTRVQSVKYNADESALVALRDAADAEIPFIANIYIDRHGNFAFRGRYSRFDPDTVAAEPGSDWDFTRWAVGDGNAIIADPTRAQMRVLAYTRGRRDIINVALSYPQNTAAAAIPGQVFADTTSITAYGKHVSPPLTDLLTDTYTGPGTITPNTGLSQCALFAKLLVLNQKDPREAVSALQLKSIQPTDPRAARTWKLITKADISHIVNVAVGYPAGTGFTGASPTDDYYIEGRQMRVRPANSGYDYVELDLEVSPAVWSMDLNGVFPAFGSSPTPEPSNSSSTIRMRRLFGPWNMSP